MWRRILAGSKSMESKAYVNPFIDVHRKADALKKRAREEHDKEGQLRGAYQKSRPGRRVFLFRPQLHSEIALCAAAPKTLFTATHRKPY